MTRQLPQPSRDDIDIVTVLQALADPVRLELIRELSTVVEPKTCSLEAYELEISAPTLSHHWRVLRESGLTSTVVDGRTRWVELRRADIESRFPGLLSAVLTDKPAKQFSRTGDVADLNEAAVAGAKAVKPPGM